MSDAVRLREVRVEDLPVLFAQQLEPEATRMAAFPSRDEAAFHAHWAKILGDSTLTTRAIEADGRVAGWIGAFDLDGERQVGYWVGKEFWGQGIASRALALLLAEEPFRPLHAHVAKHNVGSIRVLEKCGFELLREARVEEGGEVVEELVLVCNDWRGDTPS
ncbi:MAG TPA: GNAT family N-acetyltransferase [Thermoanaerobaculia bacterium]|nr:GNAT family N-acetyltransferase [Thermoanaerobaculia bacterium]